MKRFTLKHVLSVTVLTLGLLAASRAQAQLIPEGGNKGTTTPAKARVLELKQEHNVDINGQRGVKFLYKLEIDNAKGQTVRPTMFFLNKNDQVLKGVDRKYTNASGEMMTDSEFSPQYDKTDVNGWIFIPYSAMTGADTPEGSYQVKLLFSIFHVESGKFLCEAVKDVMTLKIGPPAKTDNGLLK